MVEVATEVVTTEVAMVVTSKEEEIEMEVKKADMADIVEDINSMEVTTRVEANKLVDIKREAIIKEVVTKVAIKEVVTKVAIKEVTKEATTREAIIKEETIKVVEAIVAETKEAMVVDLSNMTTMKKEEKKESIPRNINSQVIYV